MIILLILSSSYLKFPNLVSFQIIHGDNLRLYAILFSKETVHIVIQFRRVYLETIWDIGRDCILLNPKFLKLCDKLLVLL